MRFGNKEVTMTIKIGDSIPAMKIMQGTADGPKEVDTTEFFKGRTVVLFGVPGAFTRPAPPSICRALWNMPRR